VIIHELAKKDAQWRKMALQICKSKDLADELVQNMYIKLSERTIQVSDGYIFVTLRSLFYDSLKNNDILIDDFSKFEVEDEEYCEGIDYDELSKDLTWYERTMFEQSTLIGQRELARQTGIHIQTIHRINKMVKTKLNGKKKD
jgi:DNA-directed RNA polymerase specialized sigma24 family protein